MHHNIEHFNQMGRMHGMRFGLFPKFLLPLLIYFVAVYVIKSIALYRMAKNRELSNAWIAWIPIVHNCLLGELTGDRMWNLGGSKYVLSIFPFILIALALTRIGLFLVLPLGILYAVYYFMCLYRLFDIYKPESKDLYILSSVFLFFMGAVWMFVIRNNAPVNYKYFVKAKPATETMESTEPEKTYTFNSSVEENQTNLDSEEEKESL